VCSSDLLKESAVEQERWAGLSAGERAGRFPIGVLAEREAPGLEELLAAQRARLAEEAAEAPEAGA